MWIFFLQKYCLSHGIRILQLERAINLVTRETSLSSADSYLPRGQVPVITGGYKVRKEPSLANRCEKSGKDAKRDKFHEITGEVM